MRQVYSIRLQIDTLAVPQAIVCELIAIGPLREEYDYESVLGPWLREDEQTR
jgi:hypothetical protein